MNKLAQVGVLCQLLNCEPEEITRYSPTVYQWKGIYYEITGYKSKTAPASHYLTINYAGKKWSVRELGDKAAIIKKMKGT